MSSNNLLIVGLGNPGKKYDKTRHNCGAEFVQLLSDSLKVSLQKEDKFFGLYGTKRLNQFKVHFCIPTIYVNESGKTVSSITDYLKISNEQVLVIHDDLDLPLGKIKLKEAGGHGGHNGLRNIIDNLKGDTNFKRMRIGIDHPEKEEDVVNYVLSKFTKKERQLLEASFDNTLNLMDLIFSGNWQQAMLELHS
tara:strand:+ start:1307 stop:1885 length:579 start_codon:yes stop_codon:yes gene_type:complete